MDMSVYAPLLCTVCRIQHSLEHSTLLHIFHFSFLTDKNLQTNKQSAAEICVFKLRAFVCLEYLHKNIVSSMHKYAQLCTKTD